MKTNLILKSAQLLVVINMLGIFFVGCSGPGVQTIPCDDITSETIWTNRNDGVDYELNCVVTVNSKLTIEPGVVIRCKSNSGIVIENGGSIVAEGTAVDMIEFVGESDVAGYWKGIFIKSNNPLNSLSHCVVKNGGSSSFDGLNIKSNIRLKGNGKLKLKNSTIAKSDKVGLYIEGLDLDSDNPLAEFLNNTFTDNGDYPISTTAPAINSLDGTNSNYTGNTKNKINIRSGKLFGNNVWKKMNIPYLIEGIVLVGHYSDNANLTIEPGCTIQFAGDAGLTTGEYSTGSWLKIVGTASERITLTGETQAPGAWKGVAFQSTSPNNEIAYADISYGGSSSYTGASSKKANIHVGAWSEGALTISEASVSNSNAYGIYISNPATLVVPPSVTFSNNALGDVYDEP